MTKILIVDDDKLIRWSIKEILSQEGYDVETVATAEEALNQLKNTSYNLIFADIEINNENGIEMLKKVKGLQTEARIIILSAQTQNQVELQLKNLSIFFIIEKPFRSEQIRSIAKEALDLTNSEKANVNKIRNKNEEKAL